MVLRTEPSASGAVGLSAPSASGIIVILIWSCVVLVAGLRALRSEPVARA